MTSPIDTLRLTAEGARALIDSGDATPAEVWDAYRAAIDERNEELNVYLTLVDAPEGDGWVLSVVYRAAERTSDLAVFEATSLDRGPVALAHLSSRVPAGFHGNWRQGPL